MKNLIFYVLILNPPNQHIARKAAVRPVDFRQYMASSPAHAARKTAVRLEMLSFEAAYVLDNKGLFHSALQQDESCAGCQPLTFEIPSEHDAAIEHLSGCDATNQMYIAKPCRGSRARGITLLSSASAARALIQRRAAAARPPPSLVLQQYVTAPALLADGHKCDIRMFVLITADAQGSAAFLYNEAIVRRACLPFSLEVGAETHSAAEVLGTHCCNLSVRARAGGAVGPSDERTGDQSSRGAGDDEEGGGADEASVGLDALWQQLATLGLERDVVWRRIKSVVAASLRGVLPSVLGEEGRRATAGGAEQARAQLLGYDVLVDESGRPWLLEVNAAPHMRFDEIPLYASLMRDTLETLLRRGGDAAWPAALGEASREMGTAVEACEAGGTPVPSYEFEPLELRTVECATVWRNSLGS